MRVHSIIFEKIAQIVFFIANIAAVYLLLRGHNEPGGGFIAGVASAVSIVLLSFSAGVESIHRIIRIDPVKIAASGLLLAIGISTLPLAFGKPFLETFNLKWYDIPLIGDFYFGTPLLFDIGVYLVVVGVTVKIVISLMRSTLRHPMESNVNDPIFSSPMEEPIEEHPITPSAPFRGWGSPVRSPPPENPSFEERQGRESPPC